MNDNNNLIKEPPLEVEIKSRESNEFTIRGQDLKLEELIDKQRIIPCLILKYSDGSIDYPILYDIVLTGKTINRHMPQSTSYATKGEFIVRTTFRFKRISEVPDGTYEDIPGHPDSIYR
jgi:hypothetical protein